MTHMRVGKILSIRNKKKDRRPDQPINRNSYITGAAIKGGTIRESGREPREIGAGESCDSIREWKSSLPTEYPLPVRVKVSQDSRLHLAYCPWPRQSQPAASHVMVLPYCPQPQLLEVAKDEIPTVAYRMPLDGTELPCTQTECLGLTPSKAAPAPPFDYMLRSRAKDKGSQNNVVFQSAFGCLCSKFHCAPYDLRLARPLTYEALPWAYGFVPVVNPSLLRDWQILMHRALALIEQDVFTRHLARGEHDDLYETLGGWQIETLARPTSVSKESVTAKDQATNLAAQLFVQGRRSPIYTAKDRAQELVSKLFSHLSIRFRKWAPLLMPAYGNRSTPRTRTEAGWTVPLEARSRSLRLKIRGNSWELRHAYRTSKHLSFGTVPASRRKGIAPPSNELQWQTFILHLDDPRLFAFLPLYRWPIQKPGMTEQQRTWQTMAAEDAEWSKHLHSWKGVL